MASAKLAKSTVNQSQSVICKSNPTLEAPVAMSRKSRPVVMTLPTSTTNMTGFFIIVMGFSFRIESNAARVTIFGSQIEIAFSLAMIWILNFQISNLEGLPGVHQEMLHDRTQAQYWEEGQSADDQNYAYQKRGKERCRYRESAERRRCALLPAETSSQRQHRDDHQKAPEEHGDADGRVVPISIRRYTCECRTVVAGTG